MTTTAEAPPASAGGVFAPFDRDEFRADLATVSGFAADRSRAWADECVVLARLAAAVPRSRWDTRGPTPWTSFLREVAVARRCSDQAAGTEIALAVALVAAHPTTLELLKGGLVGQYTARTLVEECIGLEREAVAAVEAEVDERACRLTPSRVRDAVRKIALRYDADAAAARAAKAARGRDVQLLPQADAQAALILAGPALDLAQVYAALTAAARAAKQAGDDRGIGALRFDLAVQSIVGEPQPTDPDPADPADLAPTDPAPTGPEPTDRGPGAPAAEQPSPVGSAALVPGAPAMSGDRRCTRPIRANITLPVTTALGLDNEPGWLDGYGWISAPQCREWLTQAELRQICVTRTGQVADVAESVVRPDPTPAAIRAALLAMVAAPGPISPMTYTEQPQHDPSRRLTEFIDLRDVFCDGPTGQRVAAERCDHDHQVRYPDGPTAAWNLAARARRTHLHKHNGWLPIRTPDSTIWTTPAGQLVEIPYERRPPPDLDPDATLPDPDQLHALEAELVRIPGPEDDHPLAEPPF